MSKLIEMFENVENQSLELSTIKRTITILNLFIC